MTREARIEAAARALLERPYYRQYEWSALRAALAEPPQGAGAPTDEWRRGVLDAREFLRGMWDDGDQGNSDDAAELVLLANFAASASMLCGKPGCTCRQHRPERSPSAPRGEVCPECGVLWNGNHAVGCSRDRAPGTAP